MTLEEKIAEVAEEIHTTKYNKATAKAVGLLKAKLARLRGEQELAARKSGGGGLGYAVKKTGDATVLLAGFPSVGKSTLLNRLTNADSKVAAYDFTTLEVVPGVLEYKGAKIQLLDVPGIISGAARGKGRGKEVLAVMRNADLIIVMVDAKRLDQLGKVSEELYNANFRLGQKLPDVSIKRKSSGGVHVMSAVKLSNLDADFVKQVLKEYSILNADVVIRDDVTVDQLIDVVVGNRRYIPSIVVLNKADLLSPQDFARARVDIGGIAISAERDADLTSLKEAIYGALEFTRIFLKKVGDEADTKQPLILRGEPTVRNVCERIHKDFVKKFMYARVWGGSAKFGGQTVGLEHILGDSDVVELHARR
jgi:hypothetical protein